jgi:hypothetical protein
MAVLVSNVFSVCEVKMHLIFVLVVAGVASLAAAAIAVRSEVLRAILIGALLLGAFQVPLSVEHSVGALEAKKAIPLMRGAACEDAWRHGLAVADERVKRNVRLMFVFSGALAIVAAFRRPKATSRREARGMNKSSPF